MLCAMPVARLRLHAHTLKVEAAAWLEGGSSPLYILRHLKDAAQIEDAERLITAVHSLH